MADDTCKKGGCWLVRLIATALVLGSLLSSWAVYASSEKDNEQDKQIIALETKQDNILKNQDDQKQQLSQLIALSTQTNLLVQTHIARSN